MTFTERKSGQQSRTLLGILAVLHRVLVWKVSTVIQIFITSSLQDCSKDPRL